MEYDYNPKRNIDIILDRFNRISEMRGSSSRFYFNIGFITEPRLGTKSFKDEERKTVGLVDTTVTCRVSVKIFGEEYIVLSKVQKFEFQKYLDCPVNKMLDIFYMELLEFITFTDNNLDVDKSSILQNLLEVRTMKSWILDGISNTGNGPSEIQL